MRASRMLLVVVLATIVLPACAAEPSAEPEAATPAQATRPDPIAEQLVSAEAILDHQAALELTPEQRETLRSEMQRAQAETVEVEWELRAARESLVALLASPESDEEVILGAAQEVVDHEGRIKLIHLRLLVRLGRALSAAQRARLDALR